MTTSRTPERVTDPGSRPTVVAGATTAREDLITVVLGALLVGGLFSDAWAHTNRSGTIESFFTPWHALLYAGFALTAAWTGWVGYRRRSANPDWWRDWPVGYRLGAIGAVGFTLGGLFDMIWHTVFGVEVSLDIAFSPSHLLLAVSATLLLTSPVRAWWATGERGLRTVTGLASLALGTTFGVTLLSTFSAFMSVAPTQVYDHVSGSPSHIATALGMACYVITTLVLAVPLLMVHRRRPTPGTATVLVAVVGLFACGVLDLPGVQTTAALGAIVGAAAADLALTRLALARRSLALAGGLFAALVWTGHLVGLQLAAGVAWPAALVGGTVTVTALFGAGLGMLADRPAPVLG
jgi:hypothetical protein